MSVSRSDFKAAFSVSEQVADWLAAALSEADGALDRLHRTVAGRRDDGTGDGWEAFDQARTTLRDRIASLRQGDDPAAALAALAPLKAEVLQADTDALAAG